MLTEAAEVFDKMFSADLGKDLKIARSFWMTILTLGSSLSSGVTRAVCLL
jgi:hypothetical protein